MADSKITALTSIGASTDPANDPLVLVDVSDTSMAASGTTKKVTLNQLLGASGTATLASATITGNLTLSAGTANGVGYLNASKVLTAGNRLTFATSGFFGTKFDVVSLGAGTNYKGGILLNEDNDGFTLYGGSDYKIIQTEGYSTPTVTKFYASNVEQYRIAPSGVFTWYDGAGGTRMTLNSTGLGVGASPVGRLNIANTGADVVTSMTAVGVQRWQFIVSNSTAAFSIYDQTNSATRLLIDTSGNVGVGVTPSGSGGCLQLKSGITFPATQVASSDANTLDDYEEGTWTPTGSSAVNCTSVSVVAARYTKIGRIVTLSGNVTASVTVANTLTYVTLTGLPFNNAAVVSGSCFENNILAVGFSDVESNNAYLFFPATSELTTGSKSFFFEVTYHV